MYLYRLQLKWNYQKINIFRLVVSTVVSIHESISSLKEYSNTFETQENVYVHGAWASVLSEIKRLFYITASWFDAYVLGLRDCNLPS
jgi:hypothetical protein